MAIAHPHPRLSLNGLGWGFSAALVVLFVLCMLAALFLPMRAAHGYVALFSDAAARLRRGCGWRADLEPPRRLADRAGVRHRL